MNRLLARSATVAACLATGLAMQACGNDGTTPAGNDTLETAEAQAMALAVARFSALSAPGTSTNAVTCPLGGTVQFSGTFGPAPAADSVLRADITMTPQDCNLALDGSVFQLNGNPSVRWQGTATATGFLQPILLDYGLAGGVNWRVATPARSGACQVDLDLEGRVEYPTATSADTVPTLRGTLSGTFCGSQITLPILEVATLG